MSRRRRKRNRNQSNTGSSGNKRRSSGKGRSSKQRSDGNRERTRQRTEAGPGFWGDPSKLPEPRNDVQITDDPHAVPRSLGEPPLPQQRQIAEHYFAAIYERAVHTAGALAAAGGLIDFEALSDAED